MLVRVSLTLALAVLLTACTPSSNSNSNSAGTPGGSPATFNINQSIADQRVTPPNTPAGQCPPGSFDLTGQRVTGTGTPALGDMGPTRDLADGLQVVSLVVPDGRYTATIQPLDLSCNRGVAPPPPPLGTAVVTFSLTHQSQVDRTNPGGVCVFRSKLTFSSFVVTGVQPLDDAIQMAVKSSIHKTVDFEVANAMNRFVNGNPLPANAAGRCPDWQLLP